MYRGRGGPPALQGATGPHDVVHPRGPSASYSLPCATSTAPARTCPSRSPPCASRWPTSRRPCWRGGGWKTRCVAPRNSSARWPIRRRSGSVSCMPTERRWWPTGRSRNLLGYDSPAELQRIASTFGIFGGPAELDRLRCTLQSGSPSTLLFRRKDGQREALEVVGAGWAEAGLNAVAVRRDDSAALPRATPRSA